MNLSIAYGKGRLDFELASELNLSVVEPQYEAGLADQIGAVRQAVRNPIVSKPLAQHISENARVGIVFSDITRATPYDIILPPLIEEIESITGAEIVLFNATGTHRENTVEELDTILGPGVCDRFKVVQNKCSDAGSHVAVGTTSGGNQIYLLKEFIDCDARILTGFIEPHFFAGFSGGGKAVMPGLAGLETIQRNHSAMHLDNPNVRWGITAGNPLWEEVNEAAKMAGQLFLVNVAMNREKEITGVFAGALDAAHEAGCAFVKERAMAAVDEGFDVVITGNSGYPLDLNMYQAVKGMSAAAQVTRPDGTIIVAADCWDGIPEHGRYGELLRSAASPEELLAKTRSPGFAVQDMWQAHIHANLCRQFDVRFYSNNLTDGQITDSFMKPCRDITATVAALAEESSDLRICVLPEGPLTIPYIK